MSAKEYITCSVCGEDFTEVVEILRKKYCPVCFDEEIEKIAENVDTKILVIITNSFEGYRIEEYLGIESVEIVIGPGFLSELTGDISDMLGQRSSGFEKKLQKAKIDALKAWKILAYTEGSNAIVGLDIDYTEFSSNRIGLIINGTSV